MTAGEIARRAGGTVMRGDAGALVTSWAFDSRALDRGACFVALRGHRDGHDFVASAFTAGAHVALVERDVRDVRVGPGRALVSVDDAIAGLQAIARSARADRRDLVVVGVAGSTGKTSTKDLLAAALASRGCHANAESYNNEFGLPITLLNAPASVHVVVTEMGERFPGDIAALCEVARPQIGVVTNVGLAHAEHLGGPPGAAAAVGELLAALPHDGLAILHAEDGWTPWLAARTNASVVTVGHAAAATYSITDVALDDHARPAFSLAGHRFVVPLHGVHHVVNAAMAAAVAHRVFDIPLDEISAALADARRARWRMELVETAEGIIVVNDAYNANPTSMEAALVTLAHLPVDGRRIAVLGDMRELGEHSAEAHVAIGRRAAALGIDVVVGVGEGGAAIAGAARTSGTEVHAAEDAREALDLVQHVAGTGDAVLVKASRALGLEVVAAGLLAPTPEAAS